MANVWSFCSRYCWGKQARVLYVFVFAIIMLLTGLGAKELWTQEHRWAEIVAGMFYRHDFIHPYLGNTPYYDKPLLSYWMMAVISYVSDGVSTWSLRLPSVMAGLIALFSLYRIGVITRGRTYGLLASWMLITTYYFIFWARVSSTDMLNVAGVLGALAWYMSYRDKTSLWQYTVFYLILAITSLCKGLVGAVLPILCVGIDLCMRRSFKQHVTLKHMLAVVPGCLVYLFPFALSYYLNGSSYSDNGLYLVYRENILRFFHPFDHQDPIYTYFIFLPIYLLPWTLFFIPAVVTLKTRFNNLSLNEKWLHWSMLGLFLFFTLSGSRRDYYVLPLVPFGILVTASYLMANRDEPLVKPLVPVMAASCLLIFTFLDVYPAWYYTNYGVNRFVAELKQQAEKTLPWREWHIMTLDAESKNNFYLGLPPGNANIHIKGNIRDQYQSVEKIKEAFPVLLNPPKRTIFVTRKQYQPYMDVVLSNYKRVGVPVLHLPFFAQNNDTIAYVPIRGD